MIGADTNILLRLGDEESPDERDLARTFVREHSGRVYVNEIVLVEFAWTLARTFKKERGEVGDRISALLAAKEFVVARAAEVARALERYRSGRADFSDYLLAEINRSQGCSVTATFDVDAARSEDVFVAVSQLAR